MWVSSSLYVCMIESLASVKIMVSLDLSTTNIILTVAVVGLFALFITLLVKLNPSTEKEEDFRAETQVEEQPPRETPPVMTQSPQLSASRTDAPRAVEKPLVAVGSTTGGSSVQMHTRQETKSHIINHNRETSKPQHKTAPLRKLGFGSNNRRDCLHHFGYLRTFPKNSPIPDECFGCERIVDCLVDKKSK